MRRSAGLPVSDPSYQRGVQYLLNTQLEDGSWHVRTRAAGFQPYFDNGFPHGVDQWISAAGIHSTRSKLMIATCALYSRGFRESMVCVTRSFSVMASEQHSRNLKKNHHGDAGPE